LIQLAHLALHEPGRKLDTRPILGFIHVLTMLTGLIPDLWLFLIQSQLQSFVPYYFWQVEFSSHRFLRLDVESWGMSATLQGIGSDFDRSLGLCGNFDGNPANDFKVSISPTFTSSFFRKKCFTLLSFTYSSVLVQE